MKLDRLVIASHNAGKVAEISELIAPLGIKVISATEANIVEPEETGDTFEANASLKSEHAAAASGLPSLADDSGLVVPAIGGAPGIYSARWAGPNKNFEVAFKRIQDELALSSPSPLGGGPGWGHMDTMEVQNAPLPTSPLRVEGLYKAYFICVLALTVPGEKTQIFEGRIDGTLTFPPRGEKGFGYDPIFIPDGYDISFAQFDPALKNSISHRARAFEKFLQFMNTRN